MYYDFFKPFYFVVTDTAPKYSPKTFEEFRKRCDEIKSLIPAQGDNTVFAEKIFTFFKDCGLITGANVAFLSDKNSCNRVFRYTMNPLGGVLRKKGLSMQTGNTSRTLRYYCTKNRGRAVICEDVVFYISSQWYDTDNNQNKAEFYNWVVNKALINLSFPQNLQSRGLFYNFQV